MAIFDLNGVEDKIGYEFKDKMLLRKCFTHSSYAYEHKEESNEILEFFGDSIIEFTVTEYLCKNSSGDEGKLTVERSEIVSKEPLTDAVFELGLDGYVLLGKGQQKSAKKEDKLFSSIYEALVAGMYIDGGLTVVKKFIKDTIIKRYENKNSKKKKKEVSTDCKNEYQEYVQKRHMGSVSYETLSKIGPDHLPEFRVAALLNGKKIAEGKGLSKQKAEASAAKEALKKLKKQAGNKIEF